LRNFDTVLKLIQGKEVMMIVISKIFRNFAHIFELAASGQSAVDKDMKT